MWSRQIGALAGVSVPLQAVKHQYVVTEKIDGIVPGMATIRDPDRRTYFKEEVGGLAFGGYEPDPKPWLDVVPERFEFQLLDDDWDHFEQHLTAAMVRIPALEKAGIKQMIDGPESFTPDGNFILGEAPEVRNFFVGAGFNAFGIASAGGAGWVLADWVAKGEQPMDLWVVDIRRFSELHRDHTWTRERTLEAYGKHYTVAFPLEEYESGRPRIVSPLYERLKARRAVLGSKLGWERANWFAPRRRRCARPLHLRPRQLVRGAGRGAPGRARGGRAVRPVVLRQVRADRQGRGRGAVLGRRQRRRHARRAGSPTRRCSTRAAASSAT